MTSVLEKVEPLSDTDRKKFEKVEAKSRAKTKKEKLEGFKLTIETACPDEWGTFLKCWNSKSKNYKNCIPQAQEALICTGRFLARVNDTVVLEKYHMMKELITKQNQK